jgi:hypothetical protein
LIIANFHATVFSSNSVLAAIAAGFSGAIVLPIVRSRATGLLLMPQSTFKDYWENERVSVANLSLARNGRGCLAFAMPEKPNLVACSI